LLLCLAAPALSACTTAPPPPSPRTTVPEPTVAARALTPAERQTPGTARLPAPTPHRQHVRRRDCHPTPARSRPSGVG
ncbi:hypothetical protein ACFUYE_29350, partial [Micromonospora humida]|uniref:hypothetical protein n=1 Tax=Micromonospora humida TaxID=2809018 RepID=UPI00366C4B97